MAVAMLACAEVNDIMQEFTGVNYNTGKQIYDITNARQGVIFRCVCLGM